MERERVGNCFLPLKLVRHMREGNIMLGEMHHNSWSPCSSPLGLFSLRFNIISMALLVMLCSVWNVHALGMNRIGQELSRVEPFGVSAALKNTITIWPPQGRSSRAQPHHIPRSPPRSSVEDSMKGLVRLILLRYTWGRR